MSEQVRRKLKAALQENARLKAEVERLNERINQMEASWPRCSHHGGKVYNKVYLSSFHETTEPVPLHNPGRLFSENGESDEVARLKAEVERLKSETVKQIETALPTVEAYISKLEAENERLRKANKLPPDNPNPAPTIAPMDP